MSLCLCLLAWLFSPMVLAACDQGMEGFRGEYPIHLPAGSRGLLRVQQFSEEVVLNLVAQDGSVMRYAHPASANTDHVILLESGSEVRDLTLCVTARFSMGNPGRVDISLSDVHSENSDTVLSERDRLRYRQMSRAALLWGEDSPESRTEALAIYQQLAGMTTPSRDPIAASAALFESLALLRRSAFQQALQRLSAMKQLPIVDPVFRYKVQWKLGQSFLRLGQHDKAIENFQLAVATIEEQSRKQPGFAETSTLHLAEIRLAMAESYLAQGNRTRAEQHIAMAESAAESDYRLMGRMYDILGYLAIVNSQQPGMPIDAQREALSEAVNVMLTGRYFSEASGDRVTQAAYENNLGFVYDQLGEYHRAFQHYRQILDMVTLEEDPLVYRYASSNLGKLYQYTADYPRSASYYRQAIRLFENSSGQTSTTRCVLGTTLRLNGEVMAALAEHEACLLAAERIDRPATLALARYELGEDYLALGDRDSAWQYLRLAWEQGEEGVSDVVRSRIRRRFAWFLQQQGRSLEASAILESLISQHDEQRVDRVDQIDNLSMAMQVATQQSNAQQALDFGLQAIALIEQQYEQLESARLGAAWSARVHEIYVTLAELYLNAYFAEGDPSSLTAAFNMVERSRAMSLRQQFALQAAAQHGNNRPEPDRSMAEQMQIARISQIANAHALSAAVNPEDIHLPVSYYQHQDVLSLYRLANRQQLPLPASMQKSSIQSQLSPEQSVLYYLVGSRDVYVFTLTADDLQVAQLSSAEQMKDAVNSVRAVLADPNAVPYAQLARLSAMLLPDMSGLENTQNLIVVPHGELHSLPFSAIAMPGSRSYDSLGSRFTINTVPSLSAWLMDKPVVQRNLDTDIAIFADPLFDATQLEQALVMRDISQTRAYNWTSSLERLPATAEEAEHITRLFPSDKTVLLTGVKANRAQLLRHDVRNAKVLHIATHGYFNEASEENVGLGLSVVDENGNPDPGFVTLPELFSYEFNNQLVVISGCDTSMGRTLAGEGMMGISRGFVAQGARHVIATLWPVSDQASADFMSIFYQKLLNTVHVAEALQAAQQEFRANPNYRDPYYWAAYVLTSVSPDQTLNLSMTEGAQLSL